MGSPAGKEVGGAAAAVAVAALGSGRASWPVKVESGFDAAVFSGSLDVATCMVAFSFCNNLFFLWKQKVLFFEQDLHQYINMWTITFLLVEGVLGLGTRSSFLKFLQRWLQTATRRTKKCLLANRELRCCVPSRGAVT